MSVGDLENGFLDLHGQEVHAFSMGMANVGFQRMAELLLSMLKSEAWRSYKDGLGSYAFQAGEFDYFLSQRGVPRNAVMQLPDLEAKAELESAMDERRSGEYGYRRSLQQVRNENPQVPGRPIEPFGFTQAEAKYLVNDTGAQRAVQHREALGHTVRRFTNSGGAVSKAPAKSLPLLERLRRSAVGLGDDDLADLIEALEQEQRRRKRA